MAKNFGLGSRDMAKAATFAANNAVRDGAMGFEHAAGVSAAFKQFSAFAKENGVKQMEYVTRELVQQYGEQLADRVTNNEIGQGHAQNNISAVNTVMRLATQGEWQSVHAVRDCKIDQRSAVRETPPTGLDRSTLERSLAALDERGHAVAELAREFGLRSKEASLLDAQRALREAREQKSVSIVHGTKGGRPRDITLNRDSDAHAARQLAVLERAAAAQGTARAVMPADKNWKTWREGGLRAIRETLQQHGIERIHDLRSAYACERYQQITGRAAPVLGGQAPRAADRAARWQIAQELGHGRIDVTNSYLGAHK